MMRMYCYCRGRVAAVMHRIAAARLLPERASQGGPGFRGRLTLLLRRLQGRVLVEAWQQLLQKDQVSSTAVHRRPLEPALLLLPPPLPPPLAVAVEEEEVASWSSPPQSRS